MAAQIEESWKYQYRDNVRLALQQKTSKLKQHVQTFSATGEGYRPELIVGEAKAQKRKTRYEAKTAQELDMEGRWNEPDDYDIGPFYEDKLDRVRNGIQINGAYTKASVAAHKRECDTVILDAMFDDAKIGKNGQGTPAAFDTANMRVVAGGTGLTVEKLTQAKAIFIEQEVDLDEEQPRCAITEVEWKQLLADITFVSGDFNNDKPLKKGEVEEFVGFKFELFSSKRLNKFVGAERRIPFWVPSGLELGEWDMALPDIRIAKELRGNPIEVYAMFTIGATRLDEKKVGDILCTQ